MSFSYDRLSKFNQHIFDGLFDNVKVSLLFFVQEDKNVISFLKAYITLMDIPHWSVLELLVIVFVPKAIIVQYDVSSFH